MMHLKCIADWCPGVHRCYHAKLHDEKYCHLSKKECDHEFAKCVKRGFVNKMVICNSGDKTMCEHVYLCSHSTPHEEIDCSRYKRQCFMKKECVPIEINRSRLKCEIDYCPASTCQHFLEHTSEECKTIKKLCTNAGVRCIPVNVNIHKNDGVLEKEIGQILNKYCVENRSNTPDFILAKYLLECLNAFNTATRSREQWYAKETK